MQNEVKRQADQAKRQFWYAPVLAIAMLLMMLRPLVMARLLDKTNFAAYSAGLLVAATFCMLGCLGLYNLVQRQMPVDFVRKRDEKGLVLLFQAGIMAVLCVLVGCVLCVGGVNLAGLGPRGLAVALLLGGSQQLFTLVTVESRSRGESLRFSWQNLARALLVFMGSLITAYVTRRAEITLLVEALLSFFVVWRIVGHLLKRAGCYFTELMLLALRTLVQVPWSSAFTLMGVALVTFGMTNADRWGAASLLKPELFAVYAFAWIILVAAQQVQAIINASVFPLLARLYAKKGSRESLQLANKMGFSILLLGLVLSWPGYFFVKLIIDILFVQYTPAVTILPYFIAVAILCVADFWSSYLIVVGREKKLLCVNLVSGLVGGLFWLMAYGGQFSLVSMATLALFLSLSRFILVIITAFMNKGRKVQDALS